MKNLVIACTAFLLVFSACKRDQYYKDGGTAQANYPGNMMEYLNSKSVPFDTLTQIIKLAGLEQTFTKEEFTFFAPSDEIIRRTIGNINTDGLNNYLYYAGKDTVKTLSNIDSLIWKKYLQRCMFQGVNRLKDYSQVDFNVITIYPGALYYSYSGSVFNIGVEYGDANGIKYMGYRQLALTYIPDVSRPTENWTTNLISSSDIKPVNGVVHTLVSNNSFLGFAKYEFFDEIKNAGLKYK